MMTSALERLKAIEQKATPLGEGGWGYFQHFPEFTWHLGQSRNAYRKGVDGSIAEVRTWEDAHLLCVLRTMAPELLALWEACDEVHRRGGSIDPYGAFVKEIEAINAKAKQILGED